MGFDPNTPSWVQHIAFKVKDVETLAAIKARIEGMGLSVLGPVIHELFQSIYFHDPNGHRLELAANTSTPEMLAKLHELAPAMLEDWAKTRRTVKQAAWLHAKEFEKA